MPHFDALALGRERARFESSPHIVALVRAVAGRLAALAAVWLVYRAGTSEWLTGILAQPLLADVLGAEPFPLARWVARLCTVAAGGIAAAGVLDYLDWSRTRFVVTETRLVKLTGVLQRVAMETPLERVDDLLVAQGPLGQRLDYGDLVVLRTQEGQGVVLPHLAAPFAFKRKLQALRAARLEALLRAALAPAEAQARK